MYSLFGSDLNFTVVTNVEFQCAVKTSRNGKLFYNSVKERSRIFCFTTVYFNLIILVSVCAYIFARTTRKEAVYVISLQIIILFTIIKNINLLLNHKISHEIL